MSKDQRGLITAITHDHSMYSLAASRRQGESAVFSRRFAPQMQQGGVNVIGWVIGGDPPFFGIDSINAWWGSIELLDMIWQEAAESQEVFKICLDYEDIDQAVSAGKIALILTMEGGIALQEGGPAGSLAGLRTLYKLGLRSLQLVGQGWNKLVDASLEHPRPSSGLTSFGKDVIREMNRLGMVIDTAHIPDPDPAFQDIIKISQDPVIDSHRGVRGATNLPRNLSNQRLKTIAKTGGVIGLQFFSEVLRSESNQRATIKDLIRHIDHIVNVAGIDYVSLGPDFLDSTLANRGPDHYLEGVEGLSGLPLVAEALIEHGYTNQDLQKIFGENILRVYRQVMK